MGEFSKSLGTGFLCAYCGEFTSGVTDPPKKQIVSFDGYYIDSDFEYNPSSTKTLAEQVGEWLVKEQGLTAEELVICPSCEESVYEDDFFVGEGWQCVTCETVCEDEREAEDCCSWNRNREQNIRAEREKYRASRIEEARRLLEQEGYSVNHGGGYTPPPSTSNSTISQLDQIAKGIY